MADDNYQRLRGQDSPSSSRYVSQKGLSRYKPALQSLLPIRINIQTESTGPTPTLPLEGVGFFSLITFHWLSTILWTMYRTCFFEVNLPSSDSCNINGQRLAQVWHDTVVRTGQIKASMFCVAWKFVRTRLLIAAILQIISVFLAIIAPWAVVDYLWWKEDPSWFERFMAAAILVGVEMLATLIKAWSGSIACRTALRMRSAYLSVAFKKLLRLAEPGPPAHFQQQLLVNADVIQQAVLYGSHVLTAPLVLAACIALIAPGLQLAVFLGSAFLITLVLLWVLVNLSGVLNDRVSSLSTLRHSWLTQLVENFTLVKMAVCDKLFTNVINTLHCREISFTVKTFICHAINESILQAVPIIAAMLLFCQPDLRVNVLGLFLLVTHVKDSLFRFWVGLRSLLDVTTILDQFKELLMMNDGHCFKEREKPIARDTAISLTDATFTKNPSALVPSKRKSRLSNRADGMVLNITPVLMDITMHIAKGSLVGLVGNSASSLLLALLGELNTSRGIVMRDGTCCYVNGDKPWMLTSADIRDNIILFGGSFQEKLYYRALHNCCLLDDIASFPQEDKTVVANITLTRSQAQRIALARVFYADRDLYLLDEPFSAVDGETSNLTFVRSILTQLKDKTVVIATHNIQFLSRCTEIYVLEDGHIVEQGSHETLLLDSERYQDLVSQHSNIKTNFVEADSMNSVASHETVFELNETSNIYLARGWFTASILTLLLSVVVLFSTIVLLVVNITRVGESEWYYSWFRDIRFSCSVGITVVCTGLLWQVLFTQTCKRVSQRAHSDWLRNLVRATVTTLANTAARQDILYCFSLHSQLMSYSLPAAATYSLENIMLLSGCAVLLLFKTPWSLVPLAVFYAMSVLFIAIYRRAVLEIVSAQIAKQRKLQQMIDTTMRGRSTIQALNRLKGFNAQFTVLCDSHASCVYLLDAASRWLSIRIQLLAVLFVGGVVFACSDSPQDGYLCVVLVASWQLGGYTRRAVRNIAATEASVHALKKCHAIMQGLETELWSDDPDTLSGPIDARRGASILFDDVQTSLLAGASIMIHPGEHVGVLGNGRRAVVSALYNIDNVRRGVIKVGDTDISLLPCNVYRMQLAVITRTSPIFSVTARQFLDPNNHHLDIDIYTLLRDIGIEATIRISDKLPGLPLHDRQLLWLARAVLGQPKVVVLQEGCHVTTRQVEQWLPGCTVLVIGAQQLTHLNKAFIASSGKQVIEYTTSAQLTASSDSVFETAL